MLCGWMRIYSVVTPPRSLSSYFSQLFAMTPGHLLQEFRALNRSSPQFSDRLAILLDDEGFKVHIPNLRDEDAAWLVDFLDTVSPLPHICEPCSLKPA